MECSVADAGDRQIREQTGYGDRTIIIGRGITGDGDRVVVGCVNVLGARRSRQQLEQQPRHHQYPSATTSRRPDLALAGRFTSDC